MPLTDARDEGSMNVLLCIYTPERADRGACEICGTGPSAAIHDAAIGHSRYHAYLGPPGKSCGQPEFIDRIQFDLPRYETHDADWVRRPCAKGESCGWQNGHGGECAVVAVIQPETHAFAVGGLS